MNRYAVLLATLVWLACAGAARAHSVHVFAFVDGAEIRVECGFSKKQRVRHGKLVVTDLATGAVIHEGVTDERGLYRFRPPEAFLAAGHGLNIRLHAGEGHQDDWPLSASDLAALAPPDAPAGGELEAMIQRAVATQLAPVKEALARQEERGPEFRDVAGGLGWIMGLLGLATYFRYRRDARHG